MKVRKEAGWILAYIITIFGALAAVHWGNEAVNVIAEALPAPRNHCIVIDAGHGGEDGGAISCTGKLESSYNLEIALRLRDLMNLMGHSTKMIRTADESVSITGETIAQRKASDLKQRVKIVEETPLPILVSIHQNQFPDGKYHGAQVFYASTEGSEELAVTLQKVFTETINPGSHRKAKKCSSIYLMEKISCPGILIECGFLSNFEEEARLSDPKYQKKLCCVIGTVLHQFVSST